MIAAGLGLRPGTPAEAIVTLVREAAQRSAQTPQALAAPDFRRHEPGLHQAAAALGLPLHIIPRAELEAQQPHCPTRSATALRTTGLASVAEAAALALAAPLLLPRIANAWATCALAGPHPAKKNAAPSST